MDLVATLCMQQPVATFYLDVHAGDTHVTVGRRMGYSLRALPPPAYT